MKRIYRTCTAVAIVAMSASFASCELDNYDGPDATISGAVKDVKTNDLIEQDISEGSVIRYEEQGFENPDKQQMIFKVNGEYRNDLIFSGTYDIYFEQSNFVIPERIVGYKIKPGDNKLDFIVQPYIRISNVSFKSIIKDIENKKEDGTIEIKKVPYMTATFTVTPTVDSKVAKVGFFCHIDYIVGDRYAEARAEQNVNESFKDQPKSYTLEFDASKLKAGEKYFFRVGARIDVPNAKYNYAPAKRLKI